MDVTELHDEEDLLELRHHDDSIQLWKYLNRYKFDTDDKINPINK